MTYRTAIYFLSVSTLLTTSAFAESSDARAKFSDKQTTTAVVAQDKITLGDGELSTLFKDSSQTFKEFAKNRIPSDELAKSRCIAIFPKITTAGVAVVGGYAGEGLAVCRNDAGKYSRVGFVDINGQTVGPQLGAGYTRSVVLINDAQAPEKIEKGTFDFSAQAQAVASEKAVSARTDSQKIKIYSEQEGYFAGATVGSNFMKVNKGKMEKFYKEPVTITRTLSTFEVDPSIYPDYVKDFIVVLPPKVAF